VRAGLRMHSDLLGEEGAFWRDLTTERGSDGASPSRRDVTWRDRTTQRGSDGASPWRGSMLVLTRRTKLAEF
jgi:hypothetical protein